MASYGMFCASYFGEEMPEAIPPNTEPAQQESNTVYDGTDLQLRGFESFEENSPSIEDLANPTAVAVILQRHQVTLTDLRAAKIDMARQLAKIEDLRGENLRLEVDLARANERQTILWLEIP